MEQFDYQNSGVNGATCSDLNSTYASVVAPFFSAIRKRNVASIYCGLNDYSQGTTDPNDIYARILTWVSAAKATGFTALVFTFEDTSSMPEGTRTTLNGLITAGAAGNGYTVVDIGSDSNIGCNGCKNDATYFQVDGVHPKAAGQAVIAGYLKTALLSLGFL